MKRTLLAGASALVLATTAPRAGLAQIPVTDAASITKSVAQHAQTLTQWTSQLRAMEQQYNQLRSTYEAIAHTNSVQGLASNLSRLSNTIPGAGQMTGLVNGAGSLANAASILQGNRVFAATGGDWSATELNRRARGLANIQAIAFQQMQASEQRLAGLQELMDEIDAQPDMQASAALGNRIAAEQTFLSAQQQQLTQLQILQRSQEQGDVLRTEERRRQSAEQWRDSLQPLGED